MPPGHQEVGVRDLRIARSLAANWVRAHWVAGAQRGVPSVSEAAMITSAFERSTWTRTEAISGDAGRGLRPAPTRSPRR